MGPNRRKRLIKEAFQEFADPNRQDIDRGKLGPFIEGYIEAILDTNYETWDDEGTFGSLGYSISDISERTLASMVRDCLWYDRRYGSVLEQVPIPSRRLGTMFWNSRNQYLGGFLSSELDWDISLDVLHFGAVGFGPFRLRILDGEIDADFNQAGGSIR